MPVGDLPGWSQVISEDFTTRLPIGSFTASDKTYGLLDEGCAAYSAYGEKLGVYGNGEANKYGYYDASRTLSTADSFLDMYLHVDGDTDRRVSASVAPFRPGTTTNAHQYGRWSFRMRSHKAMGENWGCVALLWPDNDDEWPQAGEIDWPEGDIHDVRRGKAATLGGFFHPRGASTGSDGQLPVPGMGALWSTWHTFTVEWLKDSLTLYLDNQVVLATTENVPSTMMRWNTQAGPRNDQKGRPLVPSGSGHIQIDWIVAYDPA